jgi:hypothetical protein
MDWLGICAPTGTVVKLHGDDCLVPLSIRRRSISRTSRPSGRACSRRCVLYDEFAATDAWQPSKSSPDKQLIVRALTPLIELIRLPRFAVGLCSVCLRPRDQPTVLLAGVHESRDRGRATRGAKTVHETLHAQVSRGSACATTEGEVIMAKKRGAGEGSVHQRKDGRWCASINLGYRNGKRHRKHILGATRGAVADKLNEELGKLRKGLNIAPEKQTVAQFLEHWLENSVKAKVRFKTHQSYTQLVNNHIVPALGRIQLMRLAPLDVQRFINAPRNCRREVFNTCS